MNNASEIYLKITLSDIDRHVFNFKKMIILKQEVYIIKDGE